MSLVQRIDADYIEAFKAKETLRVSVLRMLRAELKNREKDKRAELEDQEVIAAVRSMIKKGKEAAEAFTAGDRQDQAESELAEVEFLQAYLPPEMDEHELDELISAAIEEANAHGPADLGKVMKVLMPKVSGRVDGKLVNQKVRRALTD